MTRWLTWTAMRAAVDPISTVSWWLAGTTWDWPLFRIPSKAGLVLSGPLACTQVSPPCALTRTSKTDAVTEKVASTAVGRDELHAPAVLAPVVARCGSSVRGRWCVESGAATPGARVGEVEVGQPLGVDPVDHEPGRADERSGWRDDDQRRGRAP